MEQNLPIITKKLWSKMKMAFYILKKGVSKKKLLLDINLMLKRTKLAATTRGGVAVPSHLKYATSGGGPQEYEFSCTDPPLYHHYFTTKRKGDDDHHHQKYTNDYYISSTDNIEDTTEDDLEAIDQVLETLLSNKNYGHAKQPRITESEDDDSKCDDQHVDDAAEDFIRRFYSQLKEQSC